MFATMNLTQFLEAPVDTFLSTWQANKDPRGSQFPLVRGGPWIQLSIGLLLAIFVRFIGPAMMKNRKPFDLKPYLLIFNGLLFGMNGAGFMVTLFLSDNGRNGWDCNAASPRRQDFKTLVVVYMGYFYLCIKLLGFVRVIFEVLLKKPTARIMQILGHIVMVAFLVHSGMYFYPGGIFCFLPLSDCLNDSIVYVYFLMSTANTDTARGLWWKHKVVWAQLFHYSVLLVHAVRFLFVPDCAPLMVTAFQAIFAATSVAFTVSQFKGLLFGSQPEASAEKFLTKANQGLKLKAK